MNAKKIGLVCLVWSGAFALIEVAFLTRQNELLPLGMGHLGMVLLFTLGFTVLAAVPAILLSIRPLWAPLRRWGFPKPAGVVLVGPWLLLLILVVSYYRSYGTITPRSVQGNLVSVALGITFVLGFVLVERRSRDASRLRLAILATGLAIGLSGAVSLATVPLPPEPPDPGLAGLFDRNETGLRILLVGLDGATWEILDPLIERGDLPAFAKLRRSAAIANLATIIPTFSPAIWTSIATGQQVTDHGIYDHTRTRLPMGLPDMPRLLTRTLCLTKPAKWMMRFLGKHGGVTLLDNTPADVRNPRLWNILTRYGLDSIVLEWYVTHPAESLQGVLVSERFHRFGDEPGMVNPNELGKILASARVAPEEISDDTVFSLLEAEDLDAQGRQKLVDLNPRWFKVMRDTIARDETVLKLFPACLATVPDWRLSAVFYKAMDNVHHLSWDQRGLPAVGFEDHPERRFRTAVDRYYKIVDRQLAETLKEAGEDTVVIVVSDHGWDPLYPGHDNAPDGIFAMYGGPTVRPASRPTLHIYDVTPTVLALLGLPVADDMDGLVARQLIDPAFFEEHPLRHVERYARQPLSGQPQPPTDTELNEDTIERLKALGYLG